MPIYHRNPAAVHAEAAKDDELENLARQFQRLRDEIKVGLQPHSSARMPRVEEQAGMVDTCAGSQDMSSVAESYETGHCDEAQLPTLGKHEASPMHPTDPQMPKLAQQFKGLRDALRGHLTPSASEIRHSLPTVKELANEMDLPTDGTPEAGLAWHAAHISAAGFRPTLAGGTSSQCSAQSEPVGTKSSAGFSADERCMFEYEIIAACNSALGQASHDTLRQSEPTAPYPPASDEKRDLLDS